MKHVPNWRALARAGMMTAGLVLASAAQAAGPAGKAPAAARPPASSPALLPAMAPLQFFTIAQRLSALRAAGALPSAPPEAQPVAAALSESVADRPDADPALRDTLPPGPETILGMALLPVPGGELAEKWRDMAGRWQRDEAVIAACRGGSCDHPGAKRWISIGAAAAALSGRRQLALVHDSVNRAIRYATDYQANAAADYWASPLESIEKIGDCEDYAIAKYMMLRGLGYPAADLKLIVMFQRSSGMFHAVLAVRSEGEWLFLDNQRQDLAPAAHYSDIRPIAALDESGQAMLAVMPQPVPSVALAEPLRVEPAAPELP